MISASKTDYFDDERAQVQEHAPVYRFLLQGKQVKTSRLLQPINLRYNKNSLSHICLMHRKNLFE